MFDKKILVNGKLTKVTNEELFAFLKTTKKKILYTYGFKYRHPTTYMVEVTPEKAIEYIGNAWTDVEEKDTYIDVNSYGENDMW